MARGRPRRKTVPNPVTRTPTPVVEPDEEMPDAPEETSAPQTPQEEDTPAAEDSEPQQAVSEKSSPVIQAIPRKKRLGRPPKNRPPDWDTPRADDEHGSESGTPMKRKRGRPPGGGGFRGRPRGSMPQTTKVRVDKEGTMMDVVDDEVDLPEDAEGEEKVDKNGHLKGGRDYRVRVFTVMNRGKRLYMLSTEPARCCGFRDSYLFFTKHLQLHKVIVDEDEKRDLIDRDVIPHSYKGRSIGVVTARSVFREFGSKIIIGGRKVIDDYYAQAARNRGEVEGELADPHDRLPAEGQPYNKNQYVAWHGASAVYHTGGPSVPVTNGKVLPGKRKIQITSANWQVEHARAASRFNSTLTAQRRLNWDGVYDPHTNQMHYPKITQPTHAKWERMPPSSTENHDSSSVKVLTNGATKPITNGVQAPTVDTKFEPVPKVISRNFLVTDTVFASAPHASFGMPGPSGAGLDAVSKGLPEMTAELLGDLPAECREALIEAKLKETEWKNKWGTEAHDGMRGQLKIGFLGFPV